MLFALCAAAEAQQAKKMARIGYLGAGSENAPTPKTVLAAFKDGLRELGWAEGKHVDYELRYAEAKLDKVTKAWLRVYSGHIARLDDRNGEPEENRTCPTTLPRSDRTAVVMGSRSC